MNKFIKQLIESIDDEDFFSYLGYDTGKEVTFYVNDKLYPKNIKILGANPSLQDIENIDHIGAILSNDNGCWLLWNLNDEYWDPFGTKLSVPREDFGEIVGICVGKGMFAKVGWSGLTKKYKWAYKDNPINYTLYKVNMDGSGYISTMNIINNYSEYIQKTIWKHLVKESSNDYLLYLPNKEELKTIWINIGNKEYKNTNIYKLLSLTTSTYWSSSYYADSNGNYYNAYHIFFNNGNIYISSKTDPCRSVALLHF